MKLYFCANLEMLEDDYWKDRYFAVHKFLAKQGFGLISNVEKKFRRGDIEARKTISYSDVDAVVIEGTHISSDAIYVIATALAYKKPVLYLIEKGTTIPDQLSYVRQDKNLSKNFHLIFYDGKNNNFDSKIIGFLDLLESGALLKDRVNVKFTLRITTKIESYINWKSASVKKSKAEYVRDLLTKLMSADEKYKKYLAKQDQ